MKKEIIYKGENSLQIVKTDLNCFKYIIELYDENKGYNIGSLFLNKEQFEDLINWKKKDTSDI